VALIHDLSLNDVHSNTALHLAAWQERTDSAEIVEALLANGADPNLRDKTGSIPLHNAAQVLLHIA
jgi:ankyrin repeat protein